MRALGLLAALGVITTAGAARAQSASAPAPQWPEGTYRLRICGGACGQAPPDSVLVEGTLVLFARDLTPAESSALQPLAFAEGTPNACFAFPLSGRRGRTFAGLVSAASFHWTLRAGAVDVKLYASPDASFDALLFGFGRHLEGKGTESMATSETSSSYGVAADRVGDADLSRCRLPATP
jgi:hypothetical protein